MVDVEHSDHLTEDERQALEIALTRLGLSGPMVKRCVLEAGRVPAIPAAVFEKRYRR